MSDFDEQPPSVLEDMRTCVSVLLAASHEAASIHISDAQILHCTQFCINNPRRHFSLRVKNATSIAYSIVNQTNNVRYIRLTGANIRYVETQQASILSS
jgi:hypothetical protein